MHSKYPQQGLGLEAMRLAADRLTFSISKDTLTATQVDWLDSVSYTVRDRLVERWMKTMRRYYILVILGNTARHFDLGPIECISTT
jgi:glycogen phosphorylase